MMVMAAVNGFFSGRGQTWTVLGIEAAGTGLNVALALVLIFGRAGFPELGIAGAGWATVAARGRRLRSGWHCFAEAQVPQRNSTLSGLAARERELFGRLLKYGGPAGAQVFLDVLVFHVFVQLVGRLGEAATAATTLTVRLNMVAFLPMMGLGQAVSILVGQRLGANRPDLAERSAYTGLKWVFGYMCSVAAVYVLFPGALVSTFRGNSDAASFAAVAAIVPSLLLCVAVYSLADSINVTFSFAPARRRRHSLRVALNVRAGLADHGRADLSWSSGAGAASTGRGASRRPTSSPWPSAFSCGFDPGDGKTCE